MLRIFPGLAASKAAGYMPLQRPWDAGIGGQKVQFRREWTAAWRGSMRCGCDLSLAGRKLYLCTLEGARRRARRRSRFPSCGRPALKNSGAGPVLLGPAPLALIQSRVRQPSAKAPGDYCPATTSAWGILSASSNPSSCASTAPFPRIRRARAAPADGIPRPDRTRPSPSASTGGSRGRTSVP